MTKTFFCGFLGFVCCLFLLFLLLLEEFLVRTCARILLIQLQLNKSQQQTQIKARCAATFAGDSVPIVIENRLSVDEKLLRSFC